MKKWIILEHHPNDSRIKIDNSGTIQSLTSWMGTGGGNVPLVIVLDDEDDEERNTSSGRI